MFWELENVEVEKPKNEEAIFLSRDEEKNFPLAAPVLRENFYMDDVLCGAASLMEAKALKNQLSGILKKEEWNCTNWGSSHPELASNILGNYEFENQLKPRR
ncbi:hypothetical protein TNCV_1421821 [Trichonephila clavipes]|nr:hypothetical protein TNCV_1421821 [Trichonephila clavipes]